MITREFRRFCALATFGAASIVGAVAFAGCVGDDPSSSPDQNDGGGSDGASADGNAGGDGSSGGDSCTSTTTCGADTCVDLQSDSNHCGTCDNACKNSTGTAFACVKGTCGNKVVQVAAGSSQSCALLLDGTVWCWGSQTYGQTGVVSADGTATPQKVAGLSNIVEVHASETNECARDTDGNIWCWGNNENGQNAQPIGLDPGCGGTCNPTPKKVALPSGQKAAQLTGSIATLCARTESGDVFCWGSNASNLLNLGADVTQNSATPVKIGTFASDVMYVNLGDADYGHPGIHAFACAIRKDKTLWCWGSSTQFSELGHAASGGNPADISCTGTTDAYFCNATPQQILDVDGGAFGNVTAVTTRNEGGCVIRGDKSLWCWGFNAQGQLGLNSFDVTSHPLPTAALLDASVASIASGDLTEFAIDTSGHAYAWGADLGDVLGAGSYEVSHLVPTEDSLIGTVSQISLEADHAMALRTDGTIALWGANLSSQLGHARGTNTDVICPTDLPDAEPSCNPTPQLLQSPPWQ